MSMPMERTMATLTTSNLGLVPQRRLGALLADRRELYGFEISDMARRSMGRFTVPQLEAIEAGSVPLDDADIEALSLLYEFNSTPPRAQRSKLIVTDDEDMPLSFAHDEFDDELVLAVLQRYIALLYLLRNTEVGHQLALRSDDLEALAEAFSRNVTGVTETLERIMAEDTAIVSEHAERMRRRLVVPAAGLLVGPTPAGMLVLVK